jgi:hypothetical protein
LFAIGLIESVRSLKLTLVEPDPVRSAPEPVELTQPPLALVLLQGAELEQAQ